MSFSLGVYDLLANLIPGSFYLGLVYLVLSRLAILPFSLDEITTWYVVPLGIASYIIGLVFDPLAKKLWYLRFKGRKSQAEIVDGLNSANDVIEFSNKKFSWTILSSYVKRHNSELYQDIQRLGALSIMLRNTSFASFLLLLLSIIDILITGFSTWHISILLASLAISILSLKQAQEFDFWYLQSIYQAIAAIQLEEGSLPVKSK